MRIPSFVTQIHGPDKEKHEPRDWCSETEIVPVVGAVIEAGRDEVDVPTRKERDNESQGQAYASYSQIAGGVAENLEGHCQTPAPQL